MSEPKRRRLVVRNRLGEARAVYMLGPEDTWHADSDGVVIRKNGMTCVHSGKTAKIEEGEQ